MACERFIPSDPNWWLVSADHLNRYLFAVPFAKGRRVLDAGTGHGYGAAILAANGAASVLGVDLAPDVVEAAREAYSSPNLTFEADDCERLERVTESVDLVVSFENIEHLRDPRAFLRSAARVLAPDGILLCSTPDREASPPFVDGKPANAFHINEWYADEFAALLGDFFGDVEVLAQVRSGPAEIRRAAADELQQFFRSNVALRAYRFACRMVGRNAVTPPIAHLGVLDPLDYPIHPREVAGIFGTPWCHQAICRRPRSIT